MVAASVFIHQSVERTSAAFLAEMRRAAYVTPTSYLELLNTFTSLLGERQEALERTRSRLAVGLEKLLNTAGVAATQHHDIAGSRCFWSNHVLFLLTFDAA